VVGSFSSGNVGAQVNNCAFENEMENIIKRRDTVFFIASLSFWFNALIAAKEIER
jgi:hypothetical protein